MPTYEYRCKDCGHDLEVVQSFTDGPLTVCPVCGGPLRKVFSPVGVVLKGSGFYRTDSRAKTNGKRKTKTDAAASSDSSSGSSSESSGSGSSDSSSSSSGRSDAPKSSAGSTSSSSGDSTST